MTQQTKGEIIVLQHAKCEALGTCSSSLSTAVLVMSANVNSSILTKKAA